MFINSFAAGVFATLFIEFTAFTAFTLIAAFRMAIKRKK